MAALKSDQTLVQLTTLQGAIEGKTQIKAEGKPGGRDE